MRTKKGFAPYKQPSPADGCYIHGWRWVPTDEDYTASVFPVFRLSGSLILPTIEFAKLTSGGIRIFNYGPTLAKHQDDLCDRKSWREDDIELANDIELAGLVEALDEKNQGLVTYRLWKRNDDINREVVIVLELAEEKPQESVAPEIIKPYQRCALSPTGLHIEDQRRSLLDCEGKTPRDTGCCDYCKHILDLSAFAH
jgi:hypothetical protein